MSGRNRTISKRLSSDIVPLSSTGTAVFLAAVASGYLLGFADQADGPSFLRGTVTRMVPAIAAILFTARHSAS